MANLDGMVIVDEATPLTSGAAFVLNRAAQADGVGEIDGRWTVEVRSGSRMVLARGKPVSSYDEAKFGGHEAIQQFLDLYCASGNLGHYVTGSDEEHLAWWSGDGGVVLRTWGVSTMPTPRLTAKGTVRNPSGAVAAPQPPPRVQWHESMRFFRLSQATDDLLDAYRNLFLALESILSSIAPVQQSINKRGKIAYEMEGAWLRRAFSAAESRGLITLAQFAPPGTADPLAFIISDIYEDHRTSLFHAKTTRSVILPQDSSRRAKLGESLRRLSGIYLALARSHLKNQRPSTTFSACTVDGMLSTFLRDACLYATDDPTLMDQSLESIPDGSRAFPLATRHAPELEQPRHKTLLGEAPVSMLGDLSRLHAVLATFDGGKISYANTTEGNLSLDGIALFQAAVSLRMAASAKFRQFYTL